ncbi:MAG: hypothetical protein QXZ17_00890 [Nitrososphaerota archaeon]
MIPSSLLADPVKLLHQEYLNALVLNGQEAQISHEIGAWISIKGFNSPSMIIMKDLRHFFGGAIPQVKNLLLITSSTDLTA